MAVVVAFICEAPVLADLCGKVGLKEGLAGVCVVSRGKAGVYIQRESMDFHEEKWKLRAKLQHVHNMCMVCREGELCWRS